ncbi:MAG: zinc-ribbon domain-containing protein [Clostridia bacterium]|nr:zinc-ribbon domain-containing protein [Clostridia bacterium]
MFCENCGQENRNDRKFCTNCGASLRDYTKPKENLLMPDDLVNKNRKIKSLKARANTLTVLLLLLFAGVVGTLVATFFVAESVKFWLVVAGLSCCGLFAIKKKKKNIVAKKLSIAKE